jgi:hypothetical protein
MFSGHLSLQLVDLRMEHQVNSFMGCDYNIEMIIRKRSRKYMTPRSISPSVPTLSSGALPRGMPCITGNRGRSTTSS